MHLVGDLGVQTIFPTVRGQLIRVWYEAANGYDGRGLRFILRDEAGDCIEGRAFGYLSGIFGRKLRQYDCYSLSGFLVVPIDDKVEPIRLTTTNTPRRIFLTPHTRVNDLGVSPPYDDFYSEFGVVRDSVLWSGPKFVHLIGVVFDIGRFNGDKINFRLKDLEGSEFRCFAKGSCAVQILSMRGKYEDGFVVCILRFCRAIEEEGDVVIAADKDVTEILGNPFTLPALALRGRMRSLAVGDMPSK